MWMEKGAAACGVRPAFPRGPSTFTVKSVPLIEKLSEV